MSEHVPQQCAQCGQVDDHPKIHMLESATDTVTTKHHDCLSVAERAAHADNDKVTAIIAAADGGTRGDDLRAHIQQLHADGA